MVLLCRLLRYTPSPALLPAILVLPSILIIQSPCCFSTRPACAIRFRPGNQMPNTLAGFISFFLRLTGKSAGDQAVRGSWYPALANIQLINEAHQGWPAFNPVTARYCSTL